MTQEGQLIRWKCHRLFKGRSPEKILPFFWILSKLPSSPPSPLHFNKLSTTFSHVEIQDLKDSLGLEILQLLYIASAQQVPEPDPLPGISFDTRPDPIQF